MRLACCADKLAIALLLAVLAVSARGQNTAAPASSSPILTPRLHLGTINVSGSLRLRGEGWNWFLDDTRTRYAFGESQLRIRLAQHRRRFDWQIEFEQPTLIDLPGDAFLPGTQEPLGLGATYFAANNGHRNPAGLFLKQGFVLIRGLAGNSDTLRLGRFEFSDGMEGRPRDSSLAWLTRQRIAHRLIGDSDWTDAGRSMDGIQFSQNFGPNNNLTFVAGRPTRGVYQTDRWGEMDVDILYAAYTRELPTRRTTSEFRAFAMGYHDGRRVLKVDNRSLAARQADTHNIRIGTFGADYVLVVPIWKLGRWDWLTWGAYQTGSWGVLRQHAAAVTNEIGWQPPVPWIHPWLRAGALYASADGNPNDGKHATFFQMLPTERQYARIPFYTLQNAEDYTGQVILRPSDRLWIRSEIHKVKLHGRNDLWYQGSGAFQNTSFGYIGRPAGAQGGLANFIDLSADYRVTSRLALSFYVGALSGKSTMTDRPNGRKGGFTYLELNYAF